MWITEMIDDDNGVRAALINRSTTKASSVENRMRYQKKFSEIHKIWE